jgi:hypothetical protein
MTYTFLSQAERYQIQALMKVRQTQIEIAPFYMAQVFSFIVIKNLMKVHALLLFIDFQDKPLILCIENHTEKLSTAQSTATRSITKLPLAVS